MPFIRPSLTPRFISLTVASLMLASCSTVSVDADPTQSTIERQRDNIVTSSELSITTTSTLLSSGIDETACLAQFEVCIEQLNEGVIDDNDRNSLALVAELYLAKAKALQARDVNEGGCREVMTRPPIDPYYANAPLDDTEAKALAKHLNECRNDYRNYLLNAIKTSYAYLFFEQLQDNSNPKASRSPMTPSFLTTDRDVQTQDVYTDATDLMVKLLFSEQVYGSSRRVPVSAIDSTLHPTIDPSTELDVLSVPAGTFTKTSEPKPQVVNVLEYRFSPLTNNSKEKAQTASPIDLTNDKTDDHETIIHTYLPNEPEYHDLLHEEIETEVVSTPIGDGQRVDNSAVDAFYASHDLNFSGLNSISKREGIGVSYVTLLSNRQTASVKALLGSGGKRLNNPDPTARIHRTGNLLLTGVVIPHGDSLSELLLSDEYDLKFYNPHETRAITILDKPYYLSANFSASYGMWLAENQLNNVGYFSLLARQQSLTLPQLFMLEPYDPNKRIIIMLHGLASSPATWVGVTNDIFNDETLRDNYQVWQLFYPTNIPILENRYQIQQLIDNAYQQNDADGNDPASKHGVLIGHSMGAVLGRLMLSNDNLETKLQTQLDTLPANDKNRQLSDLILKVSSADTIQSRLQLSPLKGIDDAVFISAPFRGTDFADRWFTKALRRIIQLPAGFAQTIQGNLKSIATEGELAQNPLGALYLENGASQLSDKSSFIQLTKDVSIADGIEYHSIIANDDPDIAQGIANLQDDSPLLDLSQPVTDSDSTQSITQSSRNTASRSDNNTSTIGSNVIDNSNKAGQEGENKTKEGPAKIASINVDGQLSDELTKDLSDGIVPYASAHLEGAKSETIITGGHSIQETPQAVLTLRKILRQHLRDYPIENK